jgi:phosphatidylethanolamine-binding protein (PEBP) family uncharacterized protein
MRRSPTAHRPPAVVALVVPLVLAAACGTSGRAMREPNREAVAPTRSTAAATSSTFAPTSLQLVAEGFEPGAAMPAANGCQGRAPAVRWSGVPEGTVEVAVAFADFDESDTAKRVHWLVAGLPAPAGGTEGTLAEGGAAPAGAVTVAPYTGPCLPAGQTHTYNFMVFALPAPSGVTAATPAADAYRQLEEAAKGDIAYYTGIATGS